MRIGFIGLGHMGRPMALNLIQAGHALVVYDLQAEAVKALTHAGATAVSDVRDMATQSCDAIFSMLPGPAQVRDLFLPSAQGTGLLQALPASTLLVDCSTIDPQTAQAVAEQAAALGHHFADAPVSGGTGGAQAGTLTFMVGAQDATWQRLQQTGVLQAMGKNTVHCGAPGLGQAAKLCNNLLLGVSMVGVAEAMSLGLALGMQAETLARIINTSTGRCWSSEAYNPVPGVVPTAPASRGYSGGFGLPLMDKDLGLALAAAQAQGLTLPAAQAAAQQYQQAIADGDRALDFSAVIRRYARTAA